MPVARTVGYSDDVAVLGAPFSVVEYVPGPDDPVSRHDLDALARPDADAAAPTRWSTRSSRCTGSTTYAVGLGDFGRPTGTSPASCAVVGPVGAHGGGQTRWPTSCLARLGAAVPAQDSCSIVHGDYRVDNTMLATDDIGPRPGRGGLGAVHPR